MTDKGDNYSHLECAALTDIGRKRKNNEDSFGSFPCHGVWCVADGMGGGDDGEVASAAVVRSVDAFLSDLPRVSAGAYPASFIARGIVGALGEASGWIYRRTIKKNLKGCGSTFVGIVFDATSPGAALAMHVGDSRLYRLRGKELKQITKDHSVAEMMGTKDENQLNPMFRGMILRAVGVEKAVEVEKTPMSVAKGDIVLVCSDGLTRMLPDKRICEILKDSKGDIGKAAKTLIEEANAAGGIDNITVELIKVGPLPPPVAAIDAPHGDDSLPSSSTIRTLEREYGNSRRLIVRRTLAIIGAICAIAAFGWAVSFSFRREKPVVSAAPELESIPAPSVREGRAPSRPPSPDRQPSTAEGRDRALPSQPNILSRPAELVDSPAQTEPELSEEDKRRDALKAELKAARDRRIRKEAAAQEFETMRLDAAQKLAASYDRSFPVFAEWINAILGKGTCDRANSLCRKLNLRARDTDASVCATEFTAEIATVAMRLKEKCSRGNLRKDKAIAKLAAKCEALDGSDPALPETQRKCLELIEFVADLRRGANERK